MSFLSIFVELLLKHKNKAFGFLLDNIKVNHIEKNLKVFKTSRFFLQLQKISKAIAIRMQNIINPITVIFIESIIKKIITAAFLITLICNSSESTITKVLEFIFLSIIPFAMLHIIKIINKIYMFFRK